MAIFHFSLLLVPVNPETLEFVISKNSIIFLVLNVSIIANYYRIENKGTKGTFDNIFI